jgi:hypothetical protein
MKKVSMILLFTLVTITSLAQNKTTVGFMGGFGLNSSISGNYGVWVDLGEWGGNFTKGASVSNDDPTDYIYGNASKYTAGSSYYSFGIHRNGVFPNLFVGLGFQKITNITTNGFEGGSTLPYVNVGIKKEISFGVFRGEVVLGTFPSIGFGWGYNF